MPLRFIAGILTGVLGVVAYNNKEKITNFAKDGFDKSKEKVSEIKESACDKKEEVKECISNKVENIKKTIHEKTKPSTKTLAKE